MLLPRFSSVIQDMWPDLQEGVECDNHSLSTSPNGLVDKPTLQRMWCDMQHCGVLITVVRLINTPTVSYNIPINVARTLCLYSVQNSQLAYWNWNQLPTYVHVHFTTCNMYIRDLPDMWLCPQGIYIRHSCYNHYVLPVNSWEYC